MKKKNKIQLLVSPINLKEAGIIASSGIDILDIKNVKEGSLGANFPWVINDIVRKFKSKKIKISIALGDLPNKPGTSALAAYAAASLKADYIKAGLYGVKNASEATILMKAIAKAIRSVNKNINIVAAGYADWRAFKGLNPWDLIKAAKASGSDIVMLDTAIKNGKTLFEVMSLSEIKKFIRLAREQKLKTALAGSLKKRQIDLIKTLSPDIIGIRGAVCFAGNRQKGISKKLVKEFSSYLNF
jgi:(5-formylfuran-3-yl)methyl phosphate synthase